MNLSALLVIVPPEQTDRMSLRLDDFPELTVHYTDPSTGRIVITLEAPSIAAEVDGLRRIQRLPGVILARMVEHHFASEPGIPEATVGVPPMLRS